MNDRQYVHYGKSKKPKKIITVLCVIAAAVIALFGAIGIIAGSGGEERQAVSDAISENIELKQKLSDMQETVDGLNQKIEDLETELRQRPTFTPKPSAPIMQNSPSPSPSPSEQTAPRERIRD